MGCGCKNNRINKYVDASCLPHDPWVRAEGILAVDRCDNLIVVDKPEHELTGEQVDKLAKIIIDGDGNYALYNDGEYKATYTAEQIDELFAMYYTKEETGEIIDGVNERIDSVNSRFDDYYNKDEVDEKIQATEDLFDNYYDKGESDVRFVKNGVMNGDVEVESTGGQVYTTQPGVMFNVGYPSTPHQVVFDSDGATIDGDPIVTQEGIADAVFYDADGQISPRRDIILQNGAYLSGLSTDGRVLNLAEVNRSNDAGTPVVDMGSTAAHFNIHSFNRPAILLNGETSGQSHKVAYLEELTDLEAHVDAGLEALQDNLTAEIGDMQDNLTAHEGDYAEFRSTVNEAFNTVNGELNDLGDRISDNSERIEVNRADIEQIRQDLAETEHFRGYYATTNEITAIMNPRPGDYAYNAETGTKWIYDGITWADSLVGVPDQTVEAYNGTPLMDNEDGQAGSSNQYSRGDHRHPSDITKADKASLSNYLLLAGNSQTNPMTGDIWLGTANDLYLTDSGNSFLGQDTNSQPTVLKGNGAGGVDITSDLGPVKANGNRVVTVGMNTPDLNISSPSVELHAAEGMLLTAGDATRISAADGNIVFQPASKVFYGSSDVAGDELARMADLDTVSAGVSDLANSVDGIREQLPGFLSKAGDTMTGDLTMKDSNIILNDEQYVGFYGDGRVRIAYNKAAEELRIVTTATDNGVDVVTNPSYDSSKFKYNGREVATRDYVDEQVDAVEVVNVYEATMTDTREIILPVAVNRVINVFFERVMLYSDEFSLSGHTLIVTATDLNYSGTNKIKLIYQ